MTPTKPGTLIRTDADLTDLWRSLIGEGGFGRRTLWLTFLDADQRTLPVIAPIEDVPVDPDELLVNNLAAVVAGVVSGADDPADSAVMLLSRPGPSAMTDSDRRWARMLTAALAARGLHRWPLHLATEDQVRMFAPEDQLGAA